MAETAVNFVIDKLIPLISAEVKLLKDVKNQVTKMKEQLVLIQAYLKDADMKAEIADTSNLVKAWVKQTREVAHRIEDVVDEYLLNVAKHRQMKGVAGVVVKIRHLLISLVFGNEVACEISEIIESIDRLNKGRETFGLSPTGSGAEHRSSHGALDMFTRHDLRLGAHFTEDAQLVGIDLTANLLMDWLSCGDIRRTVISVVGTGGLGKTTLVKNVYKKQKDKNSFDCFAWITVSRSLKDEMLLRAMLQSFYDEDDRESKSSVKETEEVLLERDIEAMDKDNLITKLRSYLQGKRYMIVFDDVWERDFWEGVEFALPDNKKSSRIVITTRDKGVAEFCGRSAPVRVHELQPLSLNDSLELFYRKAFQFDAKGCPEELREFSLDIVDKCEGVPLALVAIAGLLSTKRNNVFEWEKVCSNLGWKLGTDPHLRSLNRVLSESYHDLPYHLKLCLLYFGLFPEDYAISCARLIRLWIAEGFVKKTEIENLTLEEVAEEYLAELICRSLVIVSHVYFNGKPRRCRVHDLMHDFILLKCEELKFCQVMEKEGFGFDSASRRLSMFCTNNEDVSLESTADFGKVRSCFTFKELPKPVLKSLFSSFKLLTVLDFEDAPLDFLPEEVGNLLHLTYLSARNTNIKVLPKSIGKLQNLLTLDLKRSQVRELPIEVKKLTKLRHLLAYAMEINLSLDAIQGVKIKEGIGHLRALQKLFYVDTTKGASLIKELKKLKQLRKLGVTMLTRQYTKELWCAIESMIHLHSLNIMAKDEHEILDLQLLTKPPLNLQRFYVKGRLERLPDWVSKLEKLVRIRLNWAGLTEDPLPALKDLPELLELGLYNTYNGDELHFKDGWFRKLTLLRLGKMKGLRTLKIDKGALPALENLTIKNLPLMVEVPADVQNLERIKVFSITNMPDDFVRSMRGKHHEIVNNIPMVVYSSDNKFYSLQDLDTWIDESGGQKTQNQTCDHN